MNGKDSGEYNFIIQYNKAQNKHFIKDQGKGIGTFVKLTKGLIVKNNHTIFFGNVQCKFSVSKENNEVLCIVLAEKGKKGDIL